MQNLNFFGASFKEARLVHADLRATNLAGASLQSADLSYARLTTSLLSNSLINAETKIRGAQLNLENFMVFVNAGVHDFSHCILDLRYTNPFSPMQLTGLDFSEANFVSVINIEFKACDFSNAFFGNGIRRLSHDQWERLSRLKFDTCNLNYATFKQIKLSIVNFKACQMQNINFAAVELTEIDFKQLSLLGYKQQLRHAPLSTSLSGEQIHSEARNIQSLQSKQDIFIKLLKLTQAKDSSIKLQTVQQGWYLPAYGQAHVAVDGRCVAITYAFSIAYQQNFHEIFLKNLQISSELYQRYLNLGELSRREVADLHAFDRALVSLEQGVNLNERSLPDEVSEVVGRRNFHTFTQLMQETLGDFFYHLVLKNHVIAVYRKDTYYSVFDTNSVWARQLTSLSELSIFFKKIISSYALVNHSFLVEKINFKQHIASLPLFFTQALESERTRLARQDKSMGPLMLEGESYTRVQLYDLGAQFYPQTIQGPGYLIDAELKISSEMLSDLIKNNRLSLRAKRCLSVFRRDYTRQALFISLLKLSKKILLVGSQPLRNKIYQLQAKLSSSGGYFAHNDIDSQNGPLALLNQERDEILSLLGEKGIIKSKPLIKNLIRASVSFQWLSSVYFLGNAAWQRDTVGVLLNTGEITLSFFSPLLEAKLLKLAPDKLKQLRFGKPMLRTFAVLPGSFFDVLGMVLGSIELSQAEYGSKAWRDSIASIAISGGSLIMTGSLAATSASTGVGVAAAVLIIIVSVTYSGSSAVIEYKAYPLSADQKFRLFWHGAVAQPVPQDVSLVRTQFDKYKAMAKQAWDYLQMRYLQDGMSNACAFGLENDEKTVIDLRHKQWQYPDNVVPDITELDGEIICQPAYQGIPEQRYHNEKQYGFYCENAAVLTLAESRVIKNNTKPCMHIMLNNIKTGVIHASSFWENIFLVNHLGNTTLFAADDTSNLFFLLDMRFNGEIRSGRNALNILDSRQLVGSLFFYIKPYFLAFGLMEEAANQFVIQQFQQSPTRFMLEYRENTVFVEELNYFIGRTGRTDYISCQSTETNLQVESGGGTAIYPDRIEACTRVVLSGYMQVEGQFSQEIIYYVKPSLGTTSLFISAPQVYLIFSDSAILQELSQLRYYPRENKLIFEVSIASESHIEPSKQQSFHLEINNYLLENQTSIFNFVDKYKNIIQVELLEQLEGFFKEKEATEKEAFIEIAHFSLHAETTLQDRQAILNQSQLILKSKPQYRVYNILKVKNSITLAVESVYIFATQQADIIPLNKKISFAQGKAGADIYSMDIESLQHNGSYFIDNNAIDNNLDIITLPIAIETIQVERRQDDLLLIPDREMSSCKIHVLDYFKAPCYQHFAILDSQKNLWYPEVNRLYSRLIPYYHSVYSQMPVIIDKAQMVKHAHVVIEAPLNSTSFYREKFDLVLAYEKFIIFFSDFFLFDKSWKDLQIYFSDASYLDYLNLNELSKWSIDYQQFLQNTYTQLIKSYWLDFSEDKLVEIYHNQRWLDSTHETSHSINEKKYQLGVVQLNLVSSYVEVKSVENDLYFYFNSANAVLIIKNWQEPSHRISRIKFRQANQLVFDNLDKYSFSDIQALQIYINEKILAYYLRQILDHYDKNLVTEFTVLVASQGLLSQVDAISDCLLFKNQFDLKEFVQNYVKFHASEPLQSLRLPKNSYLLLDILFLRFQLGYLNTNSFEKVSACFPFLPKERITFFLKKMHASRTNRPERTIQILASFFTGQRPELLNSLLSYLDIVLVDKQQILTNTNSSSPVGLNTTSREKRSLRATAEWDFLGGLQLVSTLFFRQTGRKFYVAREQTGLSYFESTVKALMIVEKIKVSLPNFYLNKIEEEEHLFIQLQADLSKKIFQQASLQSINKLINNFIKDLSNSIESLKRKLFILKLKESFLFEAEETSYIKKEKKLKQNKGLSPFTCVAVSFKSLFFSNPVCLETAMEKTLSNGIIKATAQGHLI
ncbi:uncharacterized protein RVIR1_13150 [Candidatus Rickettsiella viridis]|uniref:Pentapeptide repeat protein n=1 Tax=Candidatus Rickettsiella viridis TaxID=676208 RepID=A0A2Z5V5S2_9COXI|nr:uncharacterized protein RVIR1_13150 [Candidatus Rickettsiella viridis]